MADDDVVELAMVANGYTINQHSGAYCQGVAWPLEDKARVVLLYLPLKEENPDKEVSIREVEWLGECLRGGTTVQRLPLAARANFEKKQGAHACKKSVIISCCR